MNWHLSESIYAAVKDVKLRLRKTEEMLLVFFINSPEIIVCEMSQ